MKSAVRNQAGAFDLPSIITGVVVVAVLTVGVLATIFGIIPFAQDNGTRQDISAVRTAEGTARTKDGKFTDIAGLISAGYLSEKAASALENPSSGDGPFVRVDSTGKVKTVAGVNAAGDCYVALGKSDTGKIFWGSDKASDPLELKPVDDTGCITADQLKALVASLGGFEGSYAPVAPTVTGAAQDALHAAFTWNAVDTATGYRVESSVDGRAWTVINDNQTETTATVAADPSDVINVRVTARNAGGDSGYGTATVKLADPIVANGGFENGLVSWTPSATGAAAVSDPVHGGSKAAKLTANGTISTLAQTVTVPDESFSTLTFWTRATNAYGTGTQLAIVSPTGTVLATPYTSTGTDAGWVQQTVDLTGYRGQTVTLRFTESSNYNGYTGTLNLDDVILTSTPPVITAAPTRVGAAAGDTTVSLAWTAPSSPATAITSYTVTPYLNGAAQAPVTVTGSPAAASATITGLTNGASYTFTVKATNSAGTSPESAASAAVVPGPVAIANAGFEAGLKSWTTVGAVQASTTTHTGFGSAALTANGNTGTLAQSVNIPAESFTTLTFWTRATNVYGTGSRLEVLSAAGTVLATPFTTTGTDADWVQQSVDLTDYKGQTVTLRFAESSNYSGYNGILLLDDLALTSTPPVITAAPTQVAAAANDTTATVTWAAPSSRATNITAYTITPYKSGTAQAPVTITGNPAPTTATITGLDNGTSYTFTVKATNSAGTSVESAPSAAVTTVALLIQNGGFEAGLSSWATTGTVQASTTAHSGFGSASLTASGISGLSTLSQSVNIPDQVFSTLTFWERATNVMGTGNRIEVVSSAGNVLGTPFTSTSTDSGWVQRSVDLTAYRGQTVTLRFAVSSTYSGYNGTALYDDLSLATSPPVITAAPTRVGATADDTTVSLAWAAPSSPATNITSYTVTPYLNGAAKTPVTVTGNPAAAAATVTGLTNGASYTFTVKATNSAGTSPESAPSAAVVPGPVVIANAGFEAGLKSWTTTGVAAPSTNTHSGFGSASLPTGGYGLESTIAQSVNVPAEMFSNLDFWYTTDNGSMANYTKLQVLNTSGTVLATPLNTAATVGTWTKVSVDLTSYKGQTVVLKFTEHNNNSSNPGTATIDDLVLTSTPPVITAAPTRVGATADDTTVSLAWAAPSSPATNITAYTVTPYIGTVAQAPVTVTGNPATAAATITGLTNGTSYTFTVKATNSAGTSPDSAASAAVVPGPVAIANAGFEAGLRSWTTTGTAAPSTLTHTGFGSAGLSTPGYGLETTMAQSVNVPAEMSSNLDFWYTTDSGSGANYTKLQVLTTSGTVLATPLNTTSTVGTWTKVSTDLTAYKGQTVVLKFTEHNNTSSNPGTATIDDLVLTSTPPVITAAPTRVGATADDTTVSLAWAAPSSPATNITAYTITPYIGTVAQAPVTVTGNPAPASATLTGMTNGTNYTFTVKATNSAGTSPESAASAAVVPGPVVIANAGFEAGLRSWTTAGSVQASTATRTGFGSAQLNSVSAGAVNSISQSINVPANMVSNLDVWVTTNNGSAQNTTKVQILNTAGSVLATPLSTTNTYNTWLKISADMSPYQGTTVVLKMTQTNANASYPGAAYFDDLAFTSTPPAAPAAPTNVTGTAGDSVANVTWTAPASPGTNVTSYTVTPYLSGSAMAPVTVTGNPAPTAASVTGLTNGSSYTFTVKATNVAGTSAESAASPAVIPGQLPTNGGFEAGLTSWTTGGWAPTSSTTAHTGAKSALLGNVTNTESNIYQTVVVPNTSAPTLTYWYKASSGESGCNYDNLTVQARTAPATAGTVLKTTGLCTATGTAWNQVTVSLTAYKGQTISFWFNVHNDGSNASSALLDDISIAG